VPLYERILADRQRLLGVDHSDTQTTLMTLAVACHDTGRPDRALSLLEQAVATAIRLQRPQSLRGWLLHRIGKWRAELGDLNAAVAALQAAVVAHTCAFGPDHLKVASDLDALAAVQEQQGNAEGSAASRAQAERLRDRQQQLRLADG
jgi:tetratricopeptide (TPR) repeat protein